MYYYIIKVRDLVYLLDVLREGTGRRVKIRTDVQFEYDLFVLYRFLVRLPFTAYYDAESVAIEIVF